MSRQCGTCTKCCEGWLSGEAHGKPFYKGKPCHFISIGKGCSIYAKRPKDPCVSYKCDWLLNEEIPEWMKPSDINAIIDTQYIKDISYLRLIEAGETLRSNVLTYLMLYALNNKLNFYWEVNGSKNWIGAPDFLEAMKESNK